MALPKLRTDATEAWLSAHDLPAGGMTAPARGEALARLHAMGLPARRDEYWRFTDPAGLTAPEARPSEALRVERPIFEGRDRLRLVFVDGVFDAEASDGGVLDGVEITLLSDAETTEIHWARSLYGHLEAAGQSPVPRPLAALNTAAATEGLLIRVTGKAPRPLHISYRQSSETLDVLLHHVVRVEAGAALTLLETGTPGARSNVVMEACVAPGATLHHIRPQGRARGRIVASHLFARLAEGAALKSFTLALDGRLTRNEVVVDIRGDDCTAHIAGACIGSGDDVHHDDTVFVTHGALRGESRQVFKKVLRNGATGVFQGKILVKQGAQKTDGYQISQALLLDGDSQFLAKPELEIYADDVACSHGSTTGAIDETALFYLRSRGVAQTDAVRLLTLAFLAEALEEIADADLAGDLRERLADWLGRFD